MKAKKATFYFWVLLIMGGIAIYFLFPEKINLSFLNEISKKYHLAALLIYFLILSVRGLTMIPSTPILLAGILIFDPLELFAVNMVGMLTSSTIVYYLSKYLEFGLYFETKYWEYFRKIKNKLTDRELPVIVGWSFFPLVPTDLIIYVGSILRINIFKCLLGVFIGEAVLNSFYILSATMISKL